MPMPMLDRTGILYGRLTALEPTDQRSSCGSVYWLCECSCGEMHIVDGVALTSGNVQSCGCILGDRSNRCDPRSPREDPELITYNGKSLSLGQWSKKLNIPRNTIHMRLYSYGWSIEDALNTPIGSYHRRAC